MSLQRHQEPLLFAQHGAAERRFLALISALPKVSVQGYDKHRNVITGINQAKVFMVIVNLKQWGESLKT